MALFYKISIDLVDAHYLSGWCFHRFDTHKKVQLALFQNNRMLGEMTADICREDLRALGIHPDGRCGFTLILDPPIDSASSDDLTVVERESRTILARISAPGLTVKKNCVQHGRAFSLSRLTRRDQPLLLFMHIPKTAGTSFNTLVRTMIPAERAISHIEFLAPDKYTGLKKKYRFISGHLRFGIFKEFFLNDQAALYTIVREPYRHLHSHLQWVRRNKYTTGDLSSNCGNAAICNLQQRVGAIDFGNVDRLAEFAANIDAVEAAFFDNMQTRHFLDHPVSHVTTEDLEQALTHCRAFARIGITEHYSDFVKLFAQDNKLHKTRGICVFHRVRAWLKRKNAPSKTLPSLSPERRLNRSVSTPLFDVLDPAVRDALYPLVRHDLKLYEHIRTTFAARQHTRAAKV